MNALIVKVMGKTVGYSFLHSHIVSMWKLMGRMDCVNLGQDFFLTRFAVKEDHNRVLKGGPWFVRGHYLPIRHWEPNFKVSGFDFLSYRLSIMNPRCFERLEKPLDRCLGSIPTWWRSPGGDLLNYVFRLI